MTWNNLGTALREVGRFEEAITAHQRAIAICADAICAEFGDHYDQAVTLENLGDVYTDLGDPKRARRTWAAAAELYTTAAGAADDVARIRQLIAALGDR